MTGTARSTTWLRGFASRPPSRARQVGTVLLGVFLAVAVWTERGALAGVVALVFYGGMFAAVALRYEQTTAWSRAHPLLDSAIFAPLVFLAAASLTDLPLAVCALLGVGAWVLLLASMRLRKAK